MKIFSLLLIIFFLTTDALSQTKIQGVVISSDDGTPIIGVNVLVKKTNLGTVTNFDGRFELTLSDSLVRIISPLILVVNFVGYTQTEVPIDINSLTPLSITINPSTSGLDEVVVVGYGSQKIKNEREFVSFPWPPPDFSARTLLDRAFFNNAKKLKDIDSILVTALNQLGYTDKAYFYIPNGFALVTRIEQIKVDGESLTRPERWSVRTTSMKKMSWSGYLKSLFFPTSGYFRIIVFAVTDKPFNSSGKKVKKGTAINWINEGLNVLPDEIKNKDFGDNYNCTALIYEFKKNESEEDAFLLKPSALSADDHMQKSKIIEALRRK